MASVPVSTDRQVLPSDQPLPFTSPDVAAGSFGELRNKALIGLGQDITDAGNTLSDAIQKVQLEDDKREYKKLDTEMASYIRLQTYGDGTADNPGYYNQQGENAITAFPIVQGAINKKYQELLKSASNRKVGDMFSTAANERIGQFSDNSLNHVADERKKANDAVSAAHVADAKMDAATNWSDPKALERSLAIAQGEIADTAVRNGVPAAVAAENLREVQNDMIAHTVDAAIVGSPAYASKLLAQYAGTMDGATVSALKDKIHSQVMQNVSDAERFESIRDRNQARKEKAAFADAYNKQLKGELTPSALIDLSNSNSLDPHDLEFLKQGMLRHPKDYGDNRLYNERRLQIATGELTDPNTFANDDLSDEQRNGLTTDIIAQRKNDPVTSSSADQQAINDIKVKITGPKTLDDKYYDPAGPERAANAYDSYVALRHKGQTTEQALSYVLNQYRPRDVPISTLAKPSQWTGNWGDMGTKGDFIKQINDTMDATKQALHDHKIDQATFNLEMQELNYLGNAAANLSDEAYPTIPGNQ